MKAAIKEERDTLKGLFEKVIATDSRGAGISLDEALERTIEIINKKTGQGGKLLFIGNGGSASIASHLATDFVKNVRIPAMAFNDSSLLTCLGNDLGYERVFEKPVEIFATPRDILIAISSSGKSQNILRGVSAARKKKSVVITLSGFDRKNPLRGMGDVNFYVPSASYGHVEIMHLALCHLLADVIMKVKGG
ncbi:MAG: SIS domain-containing protein [Candidatus Omnitrophota bacterium]|nr:SIS domain-containing protein [Candidatus Omnitrophota bacterium]